MSFQGNIILFPLVTKQTTKEKCQELLKSNVIETFTSPWRSFNILIWKKQHKNSSYHFYIDSWIQDNSTLLPSFPHVGTDRWTWAQPHVHSPWSTLCLLVNRIKPQWPTKIAFSDGTNLRQFHYIPYGLKAAGTNYQWIINFVTSPVLGRHTVAYLDDIVIYSRNFHEHLQYLDETLKGRWKCWLQGTWSCVWSFEIVTDHSRLTYNKIGKNIQMEPWDQLIWLKSNL